MSELLGPKVTKPASNLGSIEMWDSGSGQVLLGPPQPSMPFSASS